MTPDHPSIESELNGLKPSGLDISLLDRLEACTDGSLTILTPTELQFEAALRKFQPEALPASFMADLEGIVAGIPFSRNEKVVLFPKAGAGREKTASFRRPMWAAAAAVALIGAASALLIPSTGKSPEVARTSSPTLPGNISSNVVPAGYGNGPSEAHDEGVIWNANDQPRRVLRVVYNDIVVTKNAKGENIQEIRPRVEYILTPEKVD